MMNVKLNLFRVYRVRRINRLPAAKRICYRRRAIPDLVGLIRASPTDLR